VLVDLGEQALDDRVVAAQRARARDIERDEDGLAAAAEPVVERERPLGHPLALVGVPARERDPGEGAIGARLLAADRVERRAGARLVRERLRLLPRPRAREDGRLAVRGARRLARVADALVARGRRAEALERAAVLAERVVQAPEVVPARDLALDVA